VVIVGGGFGGLHAAKSLRKTPVQVLLLDRRNFHLFQPLLYQVATGGLSPANIASPLRAVLKRQKNVEVWLAEAIDLDPAGKRVILGDYKRDVWEFLDYFTEVWKSGVLPPGVATWDNTMNNSTYQAGKAVFILNPITVSLWLEVNNPELLAVLRQPEIPLSAPGNRSIVRRSREFDLRQVNLDRRSTRGFEIVHLSRDHGRDRDHG
jgi:hypothetical protein